MINNIFLFTWEEQYLIDKETERWISNFIAKFWKDTVSIFNNENRDDWAIKQTIFWWWLFSSHKLVVIKWLPLSAERWTWFNAEMVENFVDSIIKKWEDIPKDNLILFVNSNPDKRWRLYKFLKENCTVKEFNKLWNIELKNFIKDSFWDIKITENIISFFIEKVWTNLYRICSEIDKLIEYSHVHNIREIDKDLIELVTFGQNETIAFWFMDLLYQDYKQAIKYLDKIEQSWTNRNEFAWALYSQLKMGIILYEYDERWIKDANKIAQECELNPKAVFVNMKNIKQISKNWIALKKIYKWLTELDYWIKSGKVDESQFRLTIKILWKNIII